jgi:hypothetical protein
MITKNDCMSILIKLEDRGVNIDNYMRKLVVSKEIPLEVLKFISQHRGIEVADFYEMLRKKHNQKKSPLYLNIVKEVSTLDDVITTLVCLLTQITLYSNKLDNKDSFLKEVRAEEITRVLNEYFKEGTYDTCIALL